MIKVGDTVVVTTGKDKKKQGKVAKITKSGDKVFIEGVNVVKKHVKPNRQMGTAGEIVEVERPIHISNVMLFDSEAKKRTRTGMKDVKGEKVRVSKQSGNTI